MSRDITGKLYRERTYLLELKLSSVYGPSNESATLMDASISIRQGLILMEGYRGGE